MSNDENAGPANRLGENTGPASETAGNADAHQSAADIARGTQRLLLDMGLTSLCEFSLANGRRVDVAGLGKDGRLFFVEIKSSLADFRSDNKWHEYLDYCDTFYFAVAPDFPSEVLPQDHGLIIADRYGAEVLRVDASEQKLGAARRKAVTLRFARTAATRLGQALDEDTLPFKM